MPSLQWHIEPIRVSRSVLPVVSDLCELEAVTNNTLVSILRQLSSLVVAADKVFADTKEECKVLLDRTIALRNRVESLSCQTQKLNAKLVKVPVADLNKFMKIENHFKRNERIDTNLLTPETRSRFIRETYQIANTPVTIIGRSVHCRQNGVQTNVKTILKDMNKRLDILEIETQKPAELANFDKLPNSVILMRAKSPLFKFSSTSVGNEENTNEILQDKNDTAANDSIYRLPSPKEMTKALAEEYPSSYVPIDISGVGFQRMSSFRRSLIHSEFCIRRKNNGTHKGKSKHVRRRNTLSELDLTGLALESERKRLRRRSEGSLKRIDNFCQTETNEEEIYSTGRVVDCVKNSSENKLQLKVEVHAENFSDEHAEGTLQKESHNQLKHSKLLSPLSTIGVKLREPLQSKSGDDGRSSSGNWSASSSTHASVDSDNVVSTEGNVFVNKQILNSSSSSLEKDSVISDGNVQVNSDSRNEFNGYLSDTSGVSAVNKDQSHVKTTEAVNEVLIRTNSKVSVKFANRNSESWLQYFDYDSSDTITVSEAAASDSDTVTSKDNSPQAEESSKLREFPLNQMDDELESLYSVDNDGYYTSMHTDSGLVRERSTYKLMITPNSSFRCKGKRDSISSVSTVGDMSINSILSRTETETSSSRMSRKSLHRYPPSPPTRISSLQTYSLSNESSFSSRSHSPSPLLTVSEFEKSETVKRLKSKTAIDVTTYPSLCAAVTASEGSAEDVNSSSSSSSESVSKKRKISFTGYKRFKIKDIFGSLTTLTKSISKSKESLSKKNESSPLPFNMYGESKLNGKKIKRIETEKRDLTCVSQVMTTFNANDDNNEEADDSNAITSKTILPTKKYYPLSECSRHSTSQHINCHGFTSEERIVYTSNSLGRRRDGHPMNYLNKYHKEPKQRAATIPGVNKSRVSSPLNKTSEVNSSLHNSVANKTNLYTKRVVEIQEFQNPKKNELNSKNSVGNQTPYEGRSMSRFDQEKTLNDEHSETSNKENSSKQNPTNQNVKNCKNGPKSPESNSNINIFKCKKSKLSTEDLLFLIHTSKKKLSLKTDSSFDSSSTNSSISMSPLNSPQNNCTKRQSWAGETIANQLSAGSRNSLAIDRFGQMKATTMNDFKRLLSQTRINNNVERKSASELLKASSPFCKRPSTPMINSNKISENVPVDTRTRIINGRIYRSPYRLERMYPPIEEVGSEENLLKGEKRASEMINISADKSQYFRSSSTWV